MDKYFDTINQYKIRKLCPDDDAKLNKVCWNDHKYGISLRSAILFKGNCLASSKNMLEVVHIRKYVIRI